MDYLYASQKNLILNFTNEKLATYKSCKYMPLWKIIVHTVVPCEFNTGVLNGLFYVVYDSNIYV